MIEFLNNKFWINNMIKNYKINKELLKEINLIKLINRLIL
jgi:hypothetical protein